MPYALREVHAKVLRKKLFSNTLYILKTRKTRQSRFYRCFVVRNNRIEEITRDLAEFLGLKFNAKHWDIGFYGTGFSPVTDIVVTINQKLWADFPKCSQGYEIL